MKTMILILALSLTGLNAETKPKQGIAIEPFALSYHFDRDKDYNENHKYIGLVYRYNKFEVGVATLENSKYKRSNSIYFGYRQEIYKEEDVEVGVFADVGYRTGYKTNLLMYGGIYGEYKNIYTKVSANGNLAVVTVGYVFRF